MNNRSTKTSPRRRKQSEQAFEVQAAHTLLAFMLEAMPEKSRTTIKQLLYTGQVSINGRRCTQFDEALAAGDIVRIHANRLPDELHHPLIKVLWQDADFLIAEKKAGIPTVATSKEKERTVLRILSEHLKQFDPTVKVFMLNMLDKDAAGLLLFAKSKEAQEYVIDNWKDVVIEQRFSVVIEGQMPEKEGVLKAPKFPAWREKETQRQRLVPESMAGKARYKQLRQSEHCALLELRLLEGRNNQLRKQMKEMQLPIAGDWRNGSTFRHLKQLALFGHYMLFRHPQTGEKQEYKLPLPKLFGQLLRYTESYNPLPSELKGDAKAKKPKK